MLWQIIDGMDVGVDQFIALILGLDSCKVDQPANCPHPHHQSELSNIALASSPLVAISKGQGHFCFHILWVGSPTLIPPGSALLHCPEEFLSAIGDKGEY